MSSNLTDPSSEAEEALFDAVYEALTEWVNEDLTKYIREQHLEEDEALDKKFTGHDPQIFLRASSMRQGRHFYKTFYFVFNDLEKVVWDRQGMPEEFDFTINTSLVASEEPIPLDDIIEYMEEVPNIRTYHGKAGTDIMEGIDAVWRELKTRKEKKIRELTHEIAPKRQKGG